jgi:hypothetical protein
MANIFALENFDDFSEKINIDDLYEKKKQSDLNKLELFKKILNRIHVRIKTVSRQSLTEKYCWYVVPEIIIGVPRYDQGACIAYIMDALQNNGFKVKYFHPNTLFISWHHWVPSYVRTELKKKLGIVVNENGERIYEEKTEEEDSNNNAEQLNTFSNNNKKYTPIDSYKPSGNLVYSNDLLNKTKNKFS